jgi:hypothetical protein
VKSLLSLERKQIIYRFNVYSRPWHCFGVIGSRALTTVLENLAEDPAVVHLFGGLLERLTQHELVDLLDALIPQSRILCRQRAGCVDLLGNGLQDVAVFVDLLLDVLQIIVPLGLAGSAARVNETENQFSVLHSVKLFAFATARRCLMGK